MGTSVQTETRRDLSGPMLSKESISRLLFSLIEEFQKRQVRAGVLPEERLLSVLAATRGPEAILDTVIGEADLGVDSLKKIELISSLTRYFALDETGMEDFLVVRSRLREWVDLIHFHFEKVGQKATISFSSSGSTGTPKVTAHMRSFLESEIGAILRGPLNNLGAEGRILSTIAPHHIYGFLWTILLPQSTGVEVKSLVNLPHTSVLRAAQPGDIIVATPHFWTRFEDMSQAFPENVVGVTSGAPSQPETWFAGDRTKLSHMIEIYGSSETGGIGWRKERSSEFQLFDDIDHTHGVPTRIGLELELQDHLEWQHSGAFSVRGRKDRTQQVAGTNVDLGALRSRIKSETGARDVSLRVTDRGIKAFLAVSRSRQSDVLNAFQSLIALLPPVERPYRVDFGETLPRNEMGKLSDW